MAFVPFLLVLNTWIISYTVLVNGNPAHSPGLIFHPKDDDIRSTLIWVNATREGNVTFWTHKLDNFLREYMNPGLMPEGEQNQMSCDYDKPPSSGKVCAVDIRRWSPCIHENKYNYHRGSPCIFLSLDKIYGWRPEFYNDTNILPNLMPQFLKDQIQMGNPKYLNTVWVSCEGVYPADVENLGPIQYIPRPGFPGYFFPFMDTQGYVSPLVAVFFERPMTGVVIGVECKAWARNINNGPIERGPLPLITLHGAIRFDLLVD